MISVKAQPVYKFIISGLQEHPATVRFPLQTNGNLLYLTQPSNHAQMLTFADQLQRLAPSLALEQPTFAVVPLQHPALPGCLFSFGRIQLPVLRDSLVSQHSLSHWPAYVKPSMIIQKTTYQR